MALDNIPRSRSLAWNESAYELNPQSDRFGFSSGDYEEINDRDPNYAQPAGAYEVPVVRVCMFCLCGDIAFWNSSFWCIEYRIFTYA